MKKILFILICFLSINVINTNALEDLSLDCTKELNTKSTGASVKTLQKMLNTVANCNLRIDGGYGANTANCVQKYQEAKKISVSRIVGPKTCQLLNEDYKNKKTVSTTTKSTTETKTTTKSNTTTNDAQNKTPLLSTTNSVTTLGKVTLSKGNKGNNVRLLKQELNKAINCKLEITSEFDAKTYDCVIKFQKKYNINATAKVESKTISVLNNIYKYQQVIVKKRTNIRKNSNISSSIIKNVSKGNRLNIMEMPKNNSNWIKVEYAGKIGYINKSYVSLDFIEVDITSQVLRYYKDGNLYVDSIITTGKYGSNDTPTGYRTVKALKPNNHLMPADVTVKYWIATDSSGTIGIHDASWRGKNPDYSTYGGTVYKKNGTAGTKYSGSHGCINTPLNKVKIIFDNVSEGVPIYIY